MEEKDLIEQMDAIADTEIQLDLIIADRETLKNKQIPLSIQAELESIDLEFEPKIETIKDNIKERKEQLKSLLMKYAKPIKSKTYSWTYEPTIEWNSDALDGYALTHPEILWMRKEGKPTTRLTPKKSKI